MIPKIIHQIWVGSFKIPKRERGFANKLRDMHPDYEYKFWTSKNALSEVEEMPENLRGWYNYFHDKEDYVFAADVLRVWVVYKYGGFYLDIDMDFKKPLDDFLKYDGVFFFHGFLDSMDETAEHGAFKDLTIPNTLFFAKAGLDALKYCIDKVEPHPTNSSSWFGPSWLGERVKASFGLINEVIHQTVFDVMKEQNIHYANFYKFECKYAKHLGLASWFPEVRVTLEKEEEEKCPTCGAAVVKEITTLKTIKEIDNRAYLDKFVEALEDPVICEVGVRTADNFNIMLTPNVKTAIAVDIWRDTGVLGQNDWKSPQLELDNQYRHVYRMYESDGRVKIIREASVQAATFFEDETFDFVYIDADHTYEGVSEDIRAWYPKVKVGGIIGGHDYVEATSNDGLEFGVIKAVTEFREEKGIHVNNFHTTQGEEHFASWFLAREVI